ncbi:MAG TPA: insulinase family protein [Caulobacteraceae bacterium]|nr:insulinase family protein [Caulobacteraceae bacterium]
MRRRLCLALLATASLVAAAPAVRASAPGWPQAGSDLAADPAVRFGALANGMRYAIMRNDTPAGQTSIRLRIGSGSLEESDDQQGLAHVLEHMAFKGSTHVAAGEMVKILQREGLAFGADTNAETEWTQTVYMFDLPRSDEATIDTGLMLMRETASELLIDPKSLATERGVVLSEERLRDTPQYRAFKAQLDLLAHGQRATTRFPIGKVDIVQTAPASLIREFYRANYRPDRATLIVVGDFDPAAMEAKIKARFSDWKGVGPETAEPDPGHVEQRGLTVRIVELPGASTQTQIAWARPYDDSPDTAAKRRRDTIENLALSVLNRRLGKLARDEHPPFLGAEAAFQNLLHSDKVAIVETVSTPDGWRPALDSAEHEVRRLVTFGVRADELAREITETRTALVNAAAGAATRRTPDLATGLVGAVDENNVFTNPAEDLALFDADVKGLAPAEIDAATRAVFAGAGPLVELATPRTVDGGEAAVAAEYAKAHAEPVTAPAAEAAIAWPYASFGPAGGIAERRPADDLGATVVRFANGVGLTVKPTTFRKDQVLVSVVFGGGRAALPTDHPVAVWAAPAFTAGGFKAISLEDSERALAGRIYDANLTVRDRAFELTGTTRPADLDTQLQVLAAYVADPGFRPEAFERVRGAYLSMLPQLAATPSGVLSRDLGSLVHSGDPRWSFPDQAALAAATPDDLKALLDDPLAHGPMEITIVGDVTADRAIELAASTFGALPPRPAPAPPPPSAVHFPAPTARPVGRTDTGRADQAVAFVGWPVTDFFADMQRSRDAYLTADVLQNRLLDQVRIAQGATYSPQTQVEPSEAFAGYGYAFSLVEMPPAKIPGFYATVSQITADLRANPVSADELTRARNPHVEGIRKAQLTNEYWLQRLSGSIADPRLLDLIRTTIRDYEKVAPADIEAIARAYLTDDKAWKLVVQAAPAAAN